MGACANAATVNGMQGPCVPEPRQRRRVVLERLWILASVLWGVGRAIVVGKTLGGYGVNPWIYGLIDIATSLPLGLGTARTVEAIIDADWAAARKWASLAAAMFIAPDISIIVMGKGLPVIVYVILAAIAAVTGTLLVRSARTKVRFARRGSAESASTLDSSDGHRVPR